MKTQELLPCPCCFYLSLGGEAGYEICDVCWWEDDGQGNEDADDVRGGPNGDLSLTQARYNFARIGACSWHGFRLKTSVSLPRRAPGFPFAKVESLTNLPPIQSWPEPWTLSFHPRKRNSATRWRDGVRFLLKRGYQFQGTFEFKQAPYPVWVDPRIRRVIEYDPTIQVERAIALNDRVLVGAWFSSRSNTGVHLKFPSVFHRQTDWNEPAITMEAYTAQDTARQLFDAILQEWPLALGNCSRAPWGLQTISEMTGHPHATQFVHGTTYVESSVSGTELLRGFERRFGQESVKSVPSGFVLTGAGLRAGTPPELDAHVFLRNQLRRVAFDIIARG